MEAEIKRQIILDTETSGLDFENDRIIEIGCLELIDGIFTGKKFHKYYKPDNIVISHEAEQIHGLNNSFLSKFPSFDEDIDSFLGFIDDSELIIHNAQFDLSMINHSLKRLSKDTIHKENTLCTLEMARKKFPGSKNNLNALCRRFEISLENREKHGALTDSFLLLDVYNELLGGKQQFLEFNLDIIKQKQEIKVFNSDNFIKVNITEEEAIKHSSMLSSLKNNIW